MITETPIVDALLQNLRRPIFMPNNFFEMASDGSHGEYKRLEFLRDGVADGHGDN